MEQPMERFESFLVNEVGQTKATAGHIRAKPASAMEVHILIIYTQRERDTNEEGETMTQQKTAKPSLMMPMKESMYECQICIRKENSQESRRCVMTINNQVEL